MIGDVQATEGFSIESTTKLLEHSDAEESVPDDRAGVRPSQIVQLKFLALIADASLPVSSLQARRLIRR